MVVRFYFDYISHNAYLAWTQVLRVCDRHGATVAPVPVLFAGLLNAHGQRGPAEIPAKSLWMLRDCLRKAKHLGIPLNPPASHPFNPLLALRATCVEMPDQSRQALISALFEAVWVNGKQVSDPAVVAEIGDAAGIDGALLLQQACTDSVKLGLRRQTDEAIAAGVFGVPSMLVNDRLFWGYDDLVHLDAYLAGKDDSASSDIERWLNVTPSASRDSA